MGEYEIRFFGGAKDPKSKNILCTTREGHVNRGNIKEYIPFANAIDIPENQISQGE